MMKGRLKHMRDDTDGDCRWMIECSKKDRYRAVDVSNGQTSDAVNEWLDEQQRLLRQTE